VIRRKNNRMASDDTLNWKWEEFCLTGLNISTNTTSIAPCAQQIYFQLPIFALFAVLSSFHYGKLSTEILRNRTQIISLTLRALISLAMAILPLIKLLILMRNGTHIWPVEILLACVQAIAWTVHFALIASLRRFGEISHRGPLNLLILWSCILALSILWLETNWTTFSKIRATLNVIYALTLVPLGKSQIIIRERQREREPLINAYHRLSVDGNEESWILGAAYDGYNFFNRLFFVWVKPLIMKGSLGKLRKNEDLFDLPECLNVKKIAEGLRMNIENGKTLFKALHRSFGIEFYLIGILRLFADLSSFAGPLLLGAILKTGIDDENIDNSKRAYYYAGNKKNIYFDIVYF
jgi:ATP-binding cassette subfamily C (CFTR/MRP) protein 10